MTPQKIRPFYWSVRREIWENRAVYVAPLVVCGVIMLGFLFSLHTLPRAVLRVAASTAPRAGESLNMPYAVTAAALFMITFFVAVFYSLSALQGERRDRSILFWKSLPVSDLTVVLSKAAIPLVVQPLIIIGLGLAAHLVILLISTLVLLANGIAPSQLYAHLHLGLLWTAVPYGLLVNVLWDVPLYGYLILVSAWAKRMTFVWAVAPPLGLALFEFLAFRTRHVLDLLNDRIFGGFAHAFTIGGKGQAPLTSLGDIDPVRVVTDPGLWLGLLFGAACLAACVWLRRRAEPI
jgi:ABC-2 type transport system permease protein